MNSNAVMVIFMLCLNIASGMMITLLPDIFDDTAFNPLSYTTGDENEFLAPLEENKNAEAQLQDPSDAFDRLLDSLNIGWIMSFGNALYNYMFGFLNILEALFGANFVWRGYLFTLIRIGYVLLIFNLWTGKGFSISD